MDRKTFVQNWLIHKAVSGPDFIEEDIHRALKAYSAIEDALPRKSKKNATQGYETAKGAIISSEPLIWFESIWAEWNYGISIGSKGGKKEAGDSFLNQIKTKAEAEQAWTGAKHHARVERPKLEASGATPPYFCKWMNSGRWQTEIKQTPAFKHAQDDRKKERSLKEEIRNLNQEIFGFQKDLDRIPETDPAYDPLKNKVENMQSQLQQARFDLSKLYQQNSALS